MKKCFRFIDKSVKSCFHGGNKSPGKLFVLLLLGAVTGMLISTVGCGPSRRQYAINEALLIDQTRILEDEIYRTRTELEKCLHENAQLRSELSKGDSQSIDKGQNSGRNQTQELLPVTYSKNRPHHQVNPGEPAVETIPAQVVKARSETQQTVTGTPSVNAKNVSRPSNKIPQQIPPLNTPGGTADTTGGTTKGKLQAPVSNGTLPQIRQPQLIQPTAPQANTNVYNPVWQQKENDSQQQISPTGYDSVQENAEDELRWSPLEN